MDRNRDLTTDRRIRDLAGSEQRRVESTKILYDTSKHASSVSIVTAVVVVALFRDETPYASLVLLVLSVFFSFLAMIVVPGVILDRYGRSGLTWLFLFMLGAWVSWVLAVAWLALVVMTS